MMSLPIQNIIRATHGIEEDAMSYMSMHQVYTCDYMREAVQVHM